MRKLIAAVILAAAVLAVPAAASAQARRAWPCNTGYTCFYGNTGGTGVTTQFQNSQFQDQWTTIPTSEKGSMNANGASAVEVWNAQTGDHVCYPGNSHADLNYNFGHFYINYGHANSCAGVPPFN